MWKLIRSQPRSLLFAVLVHLAVVALLTISLNWPSLRPTLPGTKVDVVQAIAVDESKVQAELEKQQARERAREQEIKRAQEQAKQAAAERKREQERLAALKKQRADEQRKLQEAERKRKEQERVEKERLAKVEAERKAAEAKRKAEEEAKRKAAEEARLKAEAEAKRKEEEEARRRQEEARKRREAEEALKAKMAAEEQQRLAEARRAQALTTIDKYRVLIEAKVRQNWLVPPSAREGMACILSVRLIPSGEVVSVQILESSGDAVFDDSVERAVRRASPLPLPPAELGLFDEFRELRFPFELQRKG